MKYILFIITTVTLLGCSEAEHSEQDVDFRTGTLLMIDSIKAIYDRTDFSQHPYESGEQLNVIEKVVLQARANNTLSVQQSVSYALVLLNAGQSSKAIEIFETLINQFPEFNEVNESTKTLHDALGIAYMRMGEQENCIRNHSNESCLFPIKGKGLHQWKEGSRGAIQIYGRILEKFPEDYRSRWLLNVAHMTLDEYPQLVSEKWLIKPEVFESEYPLPAFENVAMNLNLDLNTLAGGIITDDFNNDGMIDLMISAWGMLDQIRYFINNGNGGFIEKTEESGLIGLTGGLNLIQADYNNDGHLDFYIMRGAWRGLSWMGYLPNSLMRNNGDGTFSDVTMESGLYRQDPTQSSVWLDYNRDGWLDLFVGNETHTDQEKHPCQLFLNMMDGTFRDVTIESGLNFTAYVKGVATGDINNDDFPDLYVSAITSTNRLFVNRGKSDSGPWKFENIAQKAGVHEPLESFPTWFFDFNNDGWEDLFVSSFDTWSFKQQSYEVAADYLDKKYNADIPRLYVNSGNEYFDDRTEAVKIDRVLSTMGCNFGDLDNDGYLDFYLGTGAPDFRSIVPNRMFRNNEGNSFQDVTFAGNFGHIQKGHGIAFADLDNDGDQDIYAVMGGSMSGDVFQNALFENPGNANNWIIIQLKGTRSNRSAIGARVKLGVEDENGALRNIYNTLGSGGSFGANSLQMEIGLGSATRITSIEVDWPDGNPKYINYGTTAMKQRIMITEGKDQIQIQPLKQFSFQKSGHSGHH